MKIKKAKKIEAALVTTLEFVRVAARYNPKATAETLEKMGVSSDVFSENVTRLVRIAIKNADSVGACVYDILAVMRKESAKRKKKGLNPNPYSDDIIAEDEDEEDDNDDTEEEHHLDEM